MLFIPNYLPSRQGISRNQELEVVIEDRHFPSAWGTNKKEAGQKAAFNALVELGVLEKTTEYPVD